MSYFNDISMSKRFQAANINDAMSNIELDIKQMKVNIYVLKVNILIYTIKSIYEKEKFTHKESTLRCKSRFDWDYGWQLTSGVRLSDRYQYHNPTSEVREIFKQLTQIKYFDHELANKNFLPNKEYYFKFSEYDSLKCLLLNDKLLHTKIN